MNENTNMSQPMHMARLTGYHLKMIAVISMLIDHIGAVFVFGLIEASYRITASMQLSDAIGDKLVVWVSQHQELMWLIYEYMRYIGRIAFPIYCFLIVEGFLHTKSVGKYALRLGVFALFSELPFNMAMRSRVWDSSYNNVFFTLLLGLLAIWGISYVEKYYALWKEKNLDEFLGKLFALSAVGLVYVLTGYLAESIFCSDYGFAGVTTIVVIYLFRKFPWFAYLLGVLALTVMTDSTEIIALLGLIPICYYSGKRGKQLKYAFYAFYPGHLLVLWGIMRLLGL